MAVFPGWVSTVFSKVYVKFSANEKGIIDSAKIMKGYNEVYNKEAIRIIKSIPEWDVYYRRGVHERREFFIPITFSHENRKKYED
jgi:hypothetical protein